MSCETADQLWHDFFYNDLIIILMLLTFHGAARTVTGSKHLLSLENGNKILLDCGMFQGLGAQTDYLNEHFGFEPSSISVVLLSHAHIDHSGLLPKLVAEGFTGKIYCTETTRHLTELLLLDSAIVQSNERDSLHTPLYGLEDVKRTMDQIAVVDFDAWFHPLPDTAVLFTQTGHLLGAAAIHLRVTGNGKETTLTYSADIGRARHPLFRPATSFPQAEYIILESTYGNKHHPFQVSHVDTLLQWIQHTCGKKGGKLIIPAFSVGRTQELLYLLGQLAREKRLPAYKYFVDSPLAMRATDIFRQYAADLHEGLGDHTHVGRTDGGQEGLGVGDGTDPFTFPGVKFVETAEDSKRLQEFDEPCVIIAASGTADAGRVRHHLETCVDKPRHTILFSGYCSPHTAGGQLLGHAKVIEVHGEKKEVRAEIAQLSGLSAHGDVDDICHFVSCQDPALVRGVFLVHGEPDAQEMLASKLSAKGFYPVQAPEMHAEVQLNVGAGSMREERVA